MDPFVTEFRSIVEDAARRLAQVPERDSARRPAPGKWSRKEIVGHLIDSAANNHQRFVRARFQDDLVFGGYEQDRWVEAQRYQEEPWPELIALWRAYNLHLAHVVEAMPAELRQREHRKHNFDRLGFGTKRADEPATLDWFVRDYVAHMQHHLAQALKVPAGEAAG